MNSISAIDPLLFTTAEVIRSQNYVLATYYIALPPAEDICRKAGNLAVGQTIGTWIPVPGITDEIRERYMGKVVRILDAPPKELDTGDSPERQPYLVTIAYPAVNFGTDFPLMLTSLLGNDASTSAQVKLMDLEFPDDYLEVFPGPLHGSAGVRERIGVQDRPLILNMVKPCTGTTPEEGAAIFYEAALGGADIIKDDELFGNPVYSAPRERVKAYRKAAERAAEKTGHKTAYFVNATCGISELAGTIREAEESGADGIMLNFAILGYSALKYARSLTSLPILGHSAGAGMYTEGTESGMATPLAVGKLARIAGADIVMLNTPYGGYPLREQKYRQILAELTLPLGKIKPSMPSIGGGVHPGIVGRYIREAGTDIILAAGGAVQGHPAGACAGAKAMRQAIDIAMKGTDFEQEAAQFPELAAALQHWGYVA